MGRSDFTLELVADLKLLGFDRHYLLSRDEGSVDSAQVSCWGKDAARRMVPVLHMF